MSIHDYIREFGLVPIKKHGSDSPFEFELRGGPEPEPRDVLAEAKGQRNKARQRRRAKNTTARKSRRANRR